MNKIVYTVDFNDAEHEGAVKSNVKAAYNMVLKCNEEAYWSSQPKRRGRKPAKVDIPVDMKYNTLLKNLRSGKTVNFHLFNDSGVVTISPRHLEAK